ncbi:uncharacterized protein [Argopecten irradians]|uniref:uncharacterized protein n=1 Tax=Argopecten irradians TaxID=31199 RepID=UPI00371FEBE4
MLQPSQTTEQENISNEDDSVYEKFHSFDFEGNVKFQAGWSRIVSAVPEERRETEFLKAKLFFYSKLYEKVTTEGYEQWLKAYSGSLPEGEVSRTDQEKSSVESKSKPEESVQIEIKNKTKESNTDVELSNEKTKQQDSDLQKGEDVVGDQGSSLEFSKIAEMIEKGLTLPGIEELNIKPLDIDPNPPEKERMKKPWEK